MSTTEPKRVAVIGGGCSGITSFWALQSSPHDVHLFEASMSPGGRMKSLCFEHGDYQFDIDSQPPSFNAETSPNLASLLHALKIAVSADHFGFCASAGIDTFEWGRSMLMTALRHPGMFCSLEGYRILFDMVRFKYTAVDVLVNKPDIYKSTVQEYLAREAFSTSFRDKYLVPLVSSLWGSNAGRILPQFPTEALYQLLYRHGLLSVSRSGPAWKRITAGANQFVQRMLRDAPAAKVHLKTRVLEAKPSPKGQTTLLTSDGRTWHFDHVIFAVDAQEAISILGSAIEPKELSILQHLRVSKHIAVLHSDPLFIPRGSFRFPFNYILSPSNDYDSSTSPKSCLSYTPSTNPAISITLDPFSPPNPRLVQDIWEYTDWDINPSTLKSLRSLASIQNKRGMSFCASWSGLGFFEDAVSVGLAVAVDHLGAGVPFALVSHGEVDGVVPRLGIGDQVVRTLVALVRVWVLLVEIFVVLARKWWKVVL